MKRFPHYQRQSRRRAFFFTAPATRAATSSRYPLGLACRPLFYYTDPRKGVIETFGGCAGEIDV
jgi:hypothetical protein